jgi:hypothetical protein
VDTVAVELAWTHVWKVAVPAKRGSLGKIGAGLLAFFVEQAQLDALRDF